jgi:8-oxo-dGTP pyrophosphatase MutT (NUDIX family)
LRISGRIADRARDILEGRLTPVAPRDAATVMLVRPVPRRAAAGPVSGTEVYLLRRRRSMAFAPGAYVFPGGSVDDSDTVGGHGWAGPPAGQFASAVGLPAAGTEALIRAAVRETFEECGVLLAGRSAEAALDDTSGEDWEADRQALAGKSISLAELLIRRGLMLRSDLMTPWSRWITPEAEPRRYDTRFFVARLPEGQRTLGGTGESDEAAWLRPGAALAAAEAGDLALLPPTAVTLQELAAHPDVAATVGTRRQIVLRQPVITFTDGQAWLVIPDDGIPASPHVRPPGLGEDTAEDQGASDDH